MARYVGASQKDVGEQDTCSSPRTGETDRPRKYFVHRLVAAAFVGPAPFDGAMVLHHNDDPTHNHPSNLYWGDRTQNGRDAPCASTRATSRTMSRSTGTATTATGSRSAC